jgi:bifunctional ADP-heptose synthase (sugar kinase/adenylyltransferase)
MDIQQLKKFKILLVGDNGIDQYQYGWVERISPEAPVPVVSFSHMETMPGMAANVKENLLALGCEVDFVHGLKTCVKTRVIDIKSKQHLCRIDQDMSSRAIRPDYGIINEYDAVVVSDYNKGSVDYETIENIRTHFNGPVFVDTKKTDLHRFEGCFVKINSVEFEAAKTFPSDLIVTLGKDGAKYQGTVYPAPAIEVTDVCGAGDTFLSALAYGYLNNGKDIVSAIKFAMRASAVTVQHVGVYAPGLKEIQ